MQKRYNWIDQARGLSIFLVVYGHNFPATEPYIYSFHVPLFFFISGMFHPQNTGAAAIKRRAKMILVPYFIWASALYLFWLFLGRNYGESATMDASPVKNFIGIFYAQGGGEYMDWGIPLWFLPCIFLVYVLRAMTQRLGNKYLQAAGISILVVLGFLWPLYFDYSLPWSLDVAMVALGFYTLGEVLKPYLVTLSTTKTILLLLCWLMVNLNGFYLNPEKVDMYRSTYGNELIFFASGLGGSIAVILFFKLVPAFNFLSYLGRHTVVLLATHIRMLTLIKIVAFFIFGIAVFNFTELEKLILSAVQVVMVIPVIWLVNKYAPILDGKVKKT